MHHFSIHASAIIGIVMSVYLVSCGTTESENAASAAKPMSAASTTSLSDDEYKERSVYSNACLFHCVSNVTTNEIGITERKFVWIPQKNFSCVSKHECPAVISFSDHGVLKVNERPEPHLCNSTDTYNQFSSGLLFPCVPVTDPNNVGQGTPASGASSPPTSSVEPPAQPSTEQPAPSPSIAPSTSESAATIHQDDNATVTTD